ncbi:MAG: efflux RND transporter periplasmic adaptor subunit [Myxococcota bacterium]|nr:efflux RND transporter periplasmic adaptor subunit [Myxococcota bacterium]
MQLRRSPPWKITCLCAMGLMGTVALPFEGVASDSAQPAIEPEIPSLREPVTALGRLEPKDGAIRVAGPAGRPAVISKLLVDDGDRVNKGDLIAVLDDTVLRQAELDRAKANLVDAEKHFERAEKLERRGVQAEATFDKAQVGLAVARADMARAEAELELAQVRSPIAGTVLRIFTRPGERIGTDGVVEVGQTDDMYAVAEVYETDIVRVRKGQRATITSPALPNALEGEVEKVGLRIGKLDILSTDPAARTDARVVEVEIRLDESQAVSGLTNLQVTVQIQP